MLFWMPVHPIKENLMPKMTGHRYFAEAMKRYGVSHLFHMNTIIPPAMLEAGKIGNASIRAKRGWAPAAITGE